MTCDNEVEELPDGLYKHRCKICEKVTILSSRKYFTRCEGSVTLLKKASNISVDYAHWLLAGCPVRTQEEQDRLHSICLSCPQYRSKAGYEWCAKCGCSLNLNSVLPSKLSWATTACPLDKWKLPDTADKSDLAQIHPTDTTLHSAD